MSNWIFNIQRYDGKTTEARLSSDQFVHAEDFDKAAARVNDILRGLRAADPERRYSITSLFTHDYRGTDCKGGIEMFETADEASARIKAEAE